MTQRRQRTRAGASAVLAAAALVALAAALALPPAAQAAREEPQAAPAANPYAPLPPAELYAKSDDRTVKAFSRPDENTTLSYTYWADRKAGLDLASGQRLVFGVPAPFNDTRLIDKITLVHRKENSGAPVSRIEKIKGVWHGKDVEYEWDMEPCYFEVSCRDRDSGRWETWRGPHGRTKRGEPRPFGDPARDTRRYAEPREAKDPDWDVLPDCAKWLGARRCDLIRVENVGGASGGKVSNGRVHGLRVQYRPFRGHLLTHHDQLHTFTQGTVFADPEVSHRLVPHFGGGVGLEPSEVDEHHTLYPGAEPVGNEEVDKELSRTYKNVTSWLRVSAGGLLVQLRPGHLFAGCDVAIGDAKINAAAKAASQANGDGQIGLRGASVVTAEMRHPNFTGEAANLTEIAGSPRVMVEGFRVERASVLSIDPPSMRDIVIPPHRPTARRNATSAPSSFVLLQAGVDPSYVMAVRCRYYRNGTVTFPPAAAAGQPGQPAAPRSNDTGAAPAAKNATAGEAKPATNGTAAKEQAAPAKQATAEAKPAAAPAKNATAAKEQAAPAKQATAEAKPAPAPAKNATGEAKPAAEQQQKANTTAAAEK